MGRKNYNLKCHVSESMLSPDLEVVLADQNEFVRLQLENDPALCQYGNPLDLKDAVQQSSVDGIREGVRIFIDNEKTQGYSFGENLFDYSISRFVYSADLKSPICRKLTENGTFQRAFPPTTDLATIHAQDIANIICDGYKDHVTRVSCKISPLFGRLA